MREICKYCQRAWSAEANGLPCECETYCKDKYYAGKMEVDNGK